MRNLYLICVALIISQITTFAQEGWFQQTSGVTNHHLNDVQFVNDSTGWTVGGNKILKTTDGGDNWHQQTSGTDRGLSSICFVNETTGWIIANGYNQSLKAKAIDTQIIKKQMLVKIGL